MPVVFNADGLILGRLCTHVAKRLLEGEEIVVVNAERAVVSGRKEQLLKHYKHRRERGKSHLTKGPYYPRTADRILKRTVRGMLEYRKPSGKAAYSRLKVYLGVPKEYENVKAESLESARKPNLARYVYLGEISERLGAR